MPLGFHHYYACKAPFPRDSPYDYYIGGFVGDHVNDPAFAAKLMRVEGLLNKKYGLAHYSAYWSPAVVKPSKARTPEQRYQTAMKKAANKHDKKIDAIKAQNVLFTEQFISEEKERLKQRQDVLRKRYNQHL
jgi:hypothetical protein